MMREILFLYPSFDSETCYIMEFQNYTIEVWVRVSLIVIDDDGAMVRWRYGAITMVRQFDGDVAKTRLCDATMAMLR